MFTRIRKQGVAGLIDFFGGSLHAVERFLQAGVEAAGVGFSRSGSASSSVNLVRDIILDVYVFGTGFSGVPDFQEFMNYRYTKAFEYHFEEMLLRSQSGE